MSINLADSLQLHFGFSSFLPGQKDAILSLLSGNHTLVVMPTGAGKSLIFQFAALQFDNLTIVISPLIALMKDQVDGLTRHNIPATYINGSLPASEQYLRLQKLKEGKYRILYIAPERLRNNSFLNAIKLQNINLLAVDEAHCISEWGHDFRPDYLHIAQARIALGNPLTVALTATATPQVQKEIIRLLRLDESTQIVTGFNRPNLTLDVKYVTGLPTKLRALNELLSIRRSGSVIVYTGTRHDAEEVTEFVREVAKLQAQFYHAGLPADERTWIQNDFISGKLNLIVSTNAFGMGIDRADVSQVIHYSMPGSLEAYYQEAGRAGRDGQPARVTLLYDPQDRALHEFFISSSSLSPSDLRTIYNVFQNDREIWITTDEISRMTGFHPVQIKVGLSELERAGALKHLSDEGYRMLFRKSDWDQIEIDKIAKSSKEHIRHRQKQLNEIVNYAESNSCRRKIILNYFGDTGETKVDDCCDNCQSAAANQVSDKETGEMTDGERIALIILDCVHRAPVKVGREKLAKILRGSKAQDILKFHHDKNVYYSKLIMLKQNEIDVMIGKLVELGYIKIIGGKFPTLSLSPRGENAIRQKERILIKYPNFIETSMKLRARREYTSNTKVDDTEKFINRGLEPNEIAQKLGLSTRTIFDYLAQLIAEGKISVEKVVSDDIRNQIEKAIKHTGSTRFLSQIKSLLPSDINYEIIQCVAAGYSSNPPEITKKLIPENPASISSDRVVELGNSKSSIAIPELINALESKNGNIRRLAASALGKICDASAVEPLIKLLEQESKPQVRQYAIKALGNIGDIRAEAILLQIANNSNEIYYVNNCAKVALKQLHRIKVSHNSNYVSNSSQPDDIASFLTRSHPRSLTGSWHTGWALGYHSRFSGNDWSRSGVGNLTYRLKYESDTTVLPELIRQTLLLFQAHPEMIQVDLIIPVPSSTERKMKPVHVFCEALSDTIKIPMQMIVAKTRQIQPQKKMKTLAQKKANITGAFCIIKEIRGKRILLVDDLFDSGATLNEISRLLQLNGATCINILTLTRTIHSDA